MKCIALRVDTRSDLPLPSFSALGRAWLWPLVGDGADDNTPKGKYVHLVTELGRDLKHLRRHEGWSAYNGQYAVREYVNCGKSIRNNTYENVLGVSIYRTIHQHWLHDYSIICMV